MIFKVLTMVFQGKYQLLCFFVANSLKARKWVQKTSIHLGNMILATIVVCEISFNKSLQGNVCIDYCSFCILGKIVAKPQKMSKNDG